MTTSNTQEHKAPSWGLLVAAAAAVAFVGTGMATGLWLPLAILAITLGIFVATLRMRPARSASPRGGRGARVITLPGVELEPSQELDEVA